MKIFLHQNLDKLYRKYSIRKWGDEYEGYIEIRAKAQNQSRNHIIASTCSKLNLLNIGSIEGKGSGHELMILLLIESYYEKVESIRLDSTSRDLALISDENLIKFYEGFGFRVEERASQFGAHATPMVGVNWQNVTNQVLRYVDKTMPQT